MARTMINQYPLLMGETIYIVELEIGLYLGEKSGRVKNIGMAKRYQNLQAVKCAILYAKRYRDWPNARIMDAITILKERTEV